MPEEIQYLPRLDRHAMIVGRTGAGKVAAVSQILREAVVGGSFCHVFTDHDHYRPLLDEFGGHVVSPGMLDGLSTADLYAAEDRLTVYQAGQDPGSVAVLLDAVYQMVLQEDRSLVDQGIRQRTILVDSVDLLFQHAGSWFLAEELWREGRKYGVTMVGVSTALSYCAGKCDHDELPLLRNTINLLMLGCGELPCPELGLMEWEIVEVKRLTTGSGLLIGLNHQSQRAARRFKLLAGR